MTPPTSPSLIVATLAPGVCQITLNRPGRLNALGAEMTDHLLTAVAAAQIDARVLLLRGAGRAFCAGADLKERQDMSEAARLAHNRAINAVCDALAATEIPTVAVLNGLALGGGCELALACDIRIAAASATVGLTEARIGAIPGAGGTQRLPRLVGIAAALDMMLSGEPVGAARAGAIGLVQAVVPDAQLEAHVLHYATLLASRSPRTARLLKRIVRGGMATSLAEGLAQERSALAEVFGSADYAEGLQAFAERRAPVFGNHDQPADRQALQNGFGVHA